MAPFSVPVGFMRKKTGGAAMPNYQDIGAEFSSGTGGTINWPASVAVGDIGLLFLETEGDITLSWTDAAGFVEVADSPQDDGDATTGTRLTVLWCRATSTTPTAPVIADTGNHQYAVILTFRGCVASGNPWDVTAGNTTGGSASTSVSIPGDTTTGANRLVVVASSTALDNDPNPRFSGWTNADLSDLTERYDDATSAGNGGGLGVATGGKAAAGAYGATTATLSNASLQGRISIALKPD